MLALQILAFSLLAGCAAPRMSAIHYSPPSVAPVRDKVRAAQAHAKAAKDALVIVGQAFPLADPNARQPGMVALQTANTEIDALTAELLSSQVALNSLEKQTSDQTDSLNRSDIEKNAALHSLDLERAKTKAIVKQRNRLFLILSGAVIWIFRTPLFALVKLIAALITKLPI